MPKPSDEETIQHLLKLCDPTNFKLNLEQARITKLVDDAQLDCSGLIKGYAIDQIAELLKNRGMNHYLIDIGGEIRASGVSLKKQV